MHYQNIHKGVLIFSSHGSVSTFPSTKSRSFKAFNEDGFFTKECGLLGFANQIYATGIRNFEIWNHHFHCNTEEDMAIFLLSFT